ERDRDRRLPGGAADRCGACGHGSSPSALSVPSRAALSRSKSAGSPGKVMRSAVSRPGRAGKSRTSTPRAASPARIDPARGPHSTSTKFACEGQGRSPAAASRAVSRRRSWRTRATCARSGSTPRSSWESANATEGAATVYGPPAARSTATTYGLPTAYPTRQPARPQALDSVRSTRTLGRSRSEEHTSELQSLRHLVCRLLLEKKKDNRTQNDRK